MSPLAKTCAHHCFSGFLTDNRVDNNITVVSIGRFGSIGSDFKRLIKSRTLGAITRTVRGYLHRASVLVHCNNSRFLLLVPRDHPGKIRDIVQHIRSTIRTTQIPDRPRLQLSMDVNKMYGIRPLARTVHRTSIQVCHGGRGKWRGDITRGLYGTFLFSDTCC